MRHTACYYNNKCISCKNPTYPHSCLLQTMVDAELGTQHIAGHEQESSKQDNSLYNYSNCFIWSYSAVAKIGIKGLVRTILELQIV